jgi:hypothetical protein
MWRLVLRAKAARNRRGATIVARQFRREARRPTRTRGTSHRSSRSDSGGSGSDRRIPRQTSQKAKRLDRHLLRPGQITNPVGRRIAAKQHFLVRPAFEIKHEKCLPSRRLPQKLDIEPFCVCFGISKCQNFQILRGWRSSLRWSRHARLLAPRTN